MKRALCAIALTAALALTAMSGQETTVATSYVVVSGDDLYTFQKDVEKYLKQGYYLYGDLEIIYNSHVNDRFRDPMFYQVVIKR